MLILRPLNHLLRGLKPKSSCLNVKWNPVADVAFVHIKSLLFNEVTLEFHSQKGSYDLFTDASDMEYSSFLTATNNEMQTKTIVRFYKAIFNAAEQTNII